MEERNELPQGQLEIHTLEIESAPVATKQGTIKIDDGTMSLDTSILLIDNLDSFTQNIAPVSYTHLTLPTILLV